MSGDIVVIGIASAPLGVDVEALASSSDHEGSERASAPGRTRGAVCHCSFATDHGVRMPVDEEGGVFERRRQWESSMGWRRSTEGLKSGLGLLVAGPCSPYQSRLPTRRQPPFARAVLPSRSRRLVRNLGAQDHVGPEADVWGESRDLAFFSSASEFVVLGGCGYAVFVSTRLRHALMVVASSSMPSVTQDMCVPAAMCSSTSCRWLAVG